MKNRDYIFPLDIQLPPSSLDDQKTLETLKLLQQYGLHGVELNITEFDAKRPVDYVATLGKYDLKLTNIATGAYAKLKDLSLSNQNENLRKNAVDELKKILAFAAEAGAGVICGFIKGGPGQPVDSARQAMEKSLAEISSVVKAYKTYLLIECTNHYESSVAINLRETVDMIEKYHNPYFMILPDTYHMNIEEICGGICQLIQYKDYYRSIHLSDNNRLFPGLGSIEFRNLMAVLKGINYTGHIVIEGKILNGLQEDLELSVEYLKWISGMFRMTSYR